MSRGRSSYRFAVRFASWWGITERQYSSPAFGRFAGPSKGGSSQSQSLTFFGLLIPYLKRDPNSYTFRVRYRQTDPWKTF